MKIVILLILISVSIAVVFLAIFYWSMKSGQYDDTYTPSVRMLFDDKKGEVETPSPKVREKQKSRGNFLHQYLREMVFGKRN